MSDKIVKSVNLSDLMRRFPCIDSITTHERFNGETSVEVQYNETVSTAEAVEITSIFVKAGIRYVG